MITWGRTPVQTITGWCKGQGALLSSHSLTRHSILFPGKLFTGKRNLSCILVSLSDLVKHGPSSGCEVSEGLVLPQLEDQLLLQHQKDVKRGCSFFPVVFPAELPKTEGTHTRSLQLLREGNEKSIRSASPPVTLEPMEPKQRALHTGNLSA